MKRFSNYLSACFTILILLISGCDQGSILNEQPRADLTPDYFKTTDGLQRGLTAAYSGMRYQYGPEGAMAITVLGTDEFTIGGMANSDEVAINGYTDQLNPSNAQFQNPWNNNFTYINTTNGIIQYGSEVTGLSSEEKNGLIAQAKFLRAAYYFIMVRMYGPVPLDLGSGPLKFNTTPVTTSERAPAADVYAAIVQDLTDAMNALPNEASEPGRADKAAAMHLLAKVYLTRGWSDAAESDDFQNAFNLATELIDNQAAYGLSLEQDFADVNAEGNEHGPESIWTVEHTTDLTFNESDVDAPANGLKENRSNYFFHPYYEVQTVNVNGEDVNPVQRTMEYQRPWIRFKPTKWLLQTAFANRTDDSRFDKTFRTLWLCNKEDVPGFAVGDTAFYMPGHDVTQAERDAHTYRIWTPDDYTDLFYPDMKKYDDTNRDDIQYSSTRPFIVYKFSETYLIAAEAALELGNPGDAVPYINAIRERAAYRADNTAQENQDAAAAMRITAGDVNIDMILNERSRELCGEQLRWFDLVRTHKLIDRVRQYNPEGATNVDEHFTLRPIPQSQIDLMTGDNKMDYQNPGY